MGQSIRQRARARAVQAAAQRRRERAEAEKRCLALGVDVAVALGERDEAVRRRELRAGEALVKLTRDEGVNISDVGEWVPDVPAAEVKRLRRLAEAEKEARRVRRDAEGAA